ncbi:MAG: hypothetical protein IPH61_09095 [Bacteroidetes bacterium]|nr:hypothetical protein [Bacteroidota bacterium]
MKTITAIVFLITCFITRSNAQSDTALLNVKYVSGETPQDNHLQVGKYMQFKGLIQGGFYGVMQKQFPMLFICAEYD